MTTTVTLQERVGTRNKMGEVLKFEIIIRERVAQKDFKPMQVLPQLQQHKVQCTRQNRYRHISNYVYRTKTKNQGNSLASNNL